MRRATLKAFFAFCLIEIVVFPLTAFAYIRTPIETDFPAPVTITWEDGDGDCSGYDYQGVILYYTGTGDSLASPFRTTGSLPQVFQLDCASRLNQGEACNYVFPVNTVYFVCSNTGNYDQSWYLAGTNPGEGFQMREPLPATPPTISSNTTTLIVTSMGAMLWNEIAGNIFTVIAITAFVGLVFWIFNTLAWWKK